MPSLLDLSLEIREMIVLKLESVEDVISLGSSCRDLARTVGQEWIWRGFFSQIELVYSGGQIREDLVRRITNFLTILDNRDAIFSLLHRTIYWRHPATTLGCRGYYTVSFPPSPRLHLVSDTGMELLALAGREDARHMVHKVKVLEISPSLLLSLASLMKERITELEVASIYCGTEDDGRALVSLLGGCSSWTVKDLALNGEVGGQTWEALGREVVMGRVKEVWTTREVVGRGRREDLRAVWENTKVGWMVEDEWISKSDAEEGKEEEEGWREIEEMIGEEWAHVTSNEGELTWEG